MTKTAEIYFTHASGGQKSEMKVLGFGKVGSFFLEAPGATLFHAPVPAPGGLHVLLAYGRITPVSASIFAWLASTCLYLQTSPL